MEGNGAPAETIGMDSERDLLRHGPTDEEGRRGLAQQVGELGFELLHHPTFAVPIGLDVGRKLRQHVGSRPIAMPGEPPGA